jgi:hypothetical protein
MDVVVDEWMDVVDVVDVVDVDGCGVWMDE